VALRGIFTIKTEASEETCVPYLHILGASSCPRGRWCGRTFHRYRNFSS
jgi:hypothetical protein